MGRKRIKDLPEFKRPREKLVERGPEALTDAELLAILLRTGVEGKSVLDLAGSILEKAGPELPRWSVKELAQIPGVGLAKACEIVAAFELARRFLLGKRPAISKPEDVLPYVQDLLDRKQEYFVLLTLTGANEVITRKVVTVGLLDSAQVHPREVFAEAIADRAAGIILVHNHPSGKLEPSSEDISLTRRLVEAGKILGIDVLDHVIVTKTGYFSFAEKGLLG